MARQVGGVHTALSTNKMAIILDFAAMAGDFTFSQFQQLHRHDHGGGVDPICANHFFIDVGRDSNHAGYDSSNVFDHTDNASSASLLQREADRQH